MKMTKSNIVIRFGYCPPNPGPKRKLKNKWYTDVNDAINDYNGEKLYISYNSQTYREITFNELLEL